MAIVDAMRFVSERIDRLAPQSFTAAGDTGAQLKLSQVPAVLGGQIPHVRAIVVNLSGTLRAGSSGAAVVLPAKLMPYLLFDIPGMYTPIQQLSADEIVALWRTENNNTFPQASWEGVAAPELYNGKPVTVVSGTDYAFSMDVPIYFSPVQNSEFDDYVQPAALYKDATFKVNIASPVNADVGGSARITAMNVTINVDVYSIPLNYIQLPSLRQWLGQDIASGTTQPTINQIAGAAKAEIVKPANSLEIPTTDWTELGFSIGDYQVSQDSTPYAAFLRRYNDAKTTVLPDHTLAHSDPERANFMPVTFPPTTNEGSRLSTDVTAANILRRVKTDQSTVTYRYLWTVQLYRDDSMLAKMQAKLGISPTAAFTWGTGDGSVPPAALAALIPVRVGSNLLG